MDAVRWQQETYKLNSTSNLGWFSLVEKEDMKSADDLNKLTIDILQRLVVRF